MNRKQQETIILKSTILGGCFFIIGGILSIILYKNFGYSYDSACSVGSFVSAGIGPCWVYAYFTRKDMDEQYKRQFLRKD